MSHLVALGVAVLGCAVLHVRFFSHVHPILSGPVSGPGGNVFLTHYLGLNSAFKIFKNLMVEAATTSRLPKQYTSSTLAKRITKQIMPRWLPHVQANQAPPTTSANTSGTSTSPGGTQVVEAAPDAEAGAPWHDGIPS